MTVMGWKRSPGPRARSNLVVGTVVALLVSLLGSATPAAATPAAATSALGAQAGSGPTNPAFDSSRPGATPGAARGYWLATASGTVLAFGGAGSRGSVTGAINHPVVGIATPPGSNGYWLAASDGGVFAFGLPFLGSTGGITLNKPVVGIAAGPTGQGYWMVASDGGVFNFGVPLYGSAGSIHLNRPVVGMAATPSGGGYWLVASDGGIFTYGDARFLGSMGNRHLNQPIVGMTPTPTGNGYWEVASDGGIFSFGDAAFFGSPASLAGVSPIVGMAAAAGGDGYWLAANDGGIFAYGAATFFGSAGGARLTAPVVGMATSQRLGTGTVGIFYYPWYASLPIDGQWRHWDEGGHTPPNDIGATYFPARGAYSSNDPGMVDAQMAEIAATGINEVIVSWWGQGSFEDKALGLVQRLAIAHGLQVAIHLEPYAGRTAGTVASDIAYLMGRGISQFYVYQASSISSAAWAGVRAQFPSVLLYAHGSVGGTRSGSLAGFALAGGFDGIYTYDPFNFSGADFAGICASAQADGLVCAPSVAPGYDATRSTGDTHVQGRNGGGTYDSRWAGAIAAGAGAITITSYNEWHESSQIEPAMPFCIPDQGSCYADYTGDYGLTGLAAQSGYLGRTAFWVADYRASL